jgi:hypothetical protein
VTDQVSPPSPDEAEVDDSEILYRRLSTASPVRLVTVDRLTQGTRPSSAAFKHRPDRDPDGLSVYRARVLAWYGLDVTAVKNDARDDIASLPASAPKTLGLGIDPDPQPDDPAPHAPKRARAHALITRWPHSTSAIGKLAKALAGAATLVTT